MADNKIDETRLKAIQIYENAKEQHANCYTLISRITNDLARSLDLGQIVDVIALLKKSDELVRDTAVEINKSLRRMQKTACMLYLRDGQLGEPVRTDWVTGTPDTKTVPPIPKFDEDPEGYRVMAQHFGIPESVIQNQAFRPHWPALVEYASAGNKLPKGMDPANCRTEYTVRCIFRRDVDAIVDDVLPPR